MSDEIKTPDADAVCRVDPRPWEIFYERKHEGTRVAFLRMEAMRGAAIQSRSVVMLATAKNGEELVGRDLFTEEEFAEFVAGLQPHVRPR